jgi:hypothetical protein
LTTCNSNHRSDFDARIRGFARFLDASWHLVNQMIPDKDDFDRASDIILESWLQGNWELLVESCLAPGEFLSPYASADWHPDSSRVTFPDAMETHVAVCSPSDPSGLAIEHLSGLPEAFPTGGCPFDAIVSKVGSWYAGEPPFAYVRIASPDRTKLFAMRDLTFSVRRIEPVKPKD